MKDTNDIKSPRERKKTAIVNTIELNQYYLTDTGCRGQPCQKRSSNTECSDMGGTDEVVVDGTDGGFS